MKRHFTVWENDMVEDIDPKVQQFMDANFPGYELQQLSALSRRDIDDVYNSLRDSHGIVIQPNLLDVKQVQEIAKAISHPIHVNNCGSQRKWSISRFIFLSNHPFETLQEFKKALIDVKDQHGEPSLIKILNSCYADFYNFDGSIHYGLEKRGYYDTIAIRYK